MSSSDLHLDKSGSLPKPKTQSPKTIRAWSQARDSFARIVTGGGVLGVLTIAYLIAVFNKIEGASSILVVIGSGLGFLLGGGKDGRQNGDE